MMDSGKLEIFHRDVMKYLYCKIGPSTVDIFHIQEALQMYFAKHVENIIQIEKDTYT